MKTRIILCMMALWAICAAAQLSRSMQPQILDDGFRLMPSTLPFKTQTACLASSYCISKPNKSGTVDPIIGNQVDFVLDFDEEQRPYQIRLLSQERTLSSFEDYQIFELVHGSNILAVPSGTYDIIVSFQHFDSTMPWWPDYNLYVVREQVTINQNMQLYFSADEAKNHIDFQKLTIDGEPVCTDLMTSDDYVNWTLIEPGNTDDMYVYGLCYHKEYGLLDVSLGNIGYRVYGSSIDNDNYFDFFINDVSNRYVFESYQVAMKGDEVFTSNCSVEGASKDTIVTNDPTNFDSYEVFEDYQVNPTNPNEPLASGFVMGFIDKKLDISPMFVRIGATIPLRKYYISAEETNMSVPFVETCGGVVREFVNDWGDDDWEFSPISLSMPITKANGQIIYANNGSDTHIENDYAFTHNPPFLGRHTSLNGGDIEEYPNHWPTHPVFSHPIKKRKDALGDNCPILVSILAQYEVFGQKHLQYQFEYLGHYGEVMYSNAVNAELEVKYNGDLLYSGEGPLNAQLDQMLNGVVDNTLTCKGLFVDGMPASNKAHLQFTAGSVDQYPPTTTMLHFKDSNEDVTSRFATAADGTLEFSAGDFNLGFTTMNNNYFDRQAPESVEVSYSPYGEDNWNELTVEEVPENYWPLMGWFYTGSLAGITGQGLNGWFDLKIRLTDAAGNWQEQVLSPAFRLDDHAYSSVATLHDSNAYEVARYNLAGQRVDTNATGVVIIKMSDGTARKIIN